MARKTDAQIRCWGEKVMQEGWGNVHSSFFASKNCVCKGVKQGGGERASTHCSAYTPVWCTAACHWSAGCAGPLMVTCSSWRLYRDSIKELFYSVKEEDGEKYNCYNRFLSGPPVRAEFAGCKFQTVAQEMFQTEKPACLRAVSLKGLISLERIFLANARNWDVLQQQH